MIVGIFFIVLLIIAIAIAAVLVPRNKKAKEIMAQAKLIAEAVVDETNVPKPVQTNFMKNSLNKYFVMNIL
jgi:hypothetical protein